MWLRDREGHALRLEHYAGNFENQVQARSKALVAVEGEYKRETRTLAVHARIVPYLSPGTTKKFFLVASSFEQYSGGSVGGESKEKEKSPSIVILGDYLRDIGLDAVSRSKTNGEKRRLQVCHSLRERCD
jgi:hypothetical protein